MSNVIGANPLPSPCPMLTSATQRIIEHLQFHVEHLAATTDAGVFAMRLHHIAQAAERHNATMNSLLSLRRDTPDFDLKEA